MCLEHTQLTRQILSTSITGPANVRVVQELSPLRAGLSSPRLGIPTPGRSEIITYHLSVGHTDWNQKCYFGLRVARRPQETTKPGSRGPTAATRCPQQWAELGVLLKTGFPPDRKGCSSSVGRSFLKTYLIPDKAKHLSVVLRLELTSVSYPFSPVQRAVLYPHWMHVST